mgnify:CR=1 FL=1
MLYVINSYNGNTEWIKDYTDEVVFYDKKDKNVGYNIFDYMDWIVKNYDNLPDVVLFGKDNMLERHITKEEFDEIKDNKTFTPILTKGHKTDGKINYYKDGLYYEVNSYWYANHYGIKDSKSFNELIDLLGVRNKAYLGFPPGGCCIVPKENILKHSKEFYIKLLEAVSYKQTPGEAHLIERCLCYIWGTDTIDGI